MVPKKPEHRRLQGDWSLKNINNMADSSEKVSFRVDMQCSSLRAKAFLVFDKGSQPIGRHLANKLPTCCQQSADSQPTNGQQSADCWQKIFVKGGKRQLANYLAKYFFFQASLRNCLNCVSLRRSYLLFSWPTVGQQSVGGAVLHFFPFFYN